MEIIVEGLPAQESEGYVALINDIMREFEIRRSIEKVYFYGDTENFVFITSIRIKKVLEPLRIEDVAIYNQEKEILSVEDEFYVPKILSLLWSLSKEGIEQIERTEIKIPLEIFNNIKSEIVYYPTEDLKNNVQEAINRVLPEAARIKYILTAEKTVTVASSENALSEDSKKLAQKMHERD
ncbi:MAG TPA: methanogenesis marker 17 protein [Methanofastidiosum sp.]|jgi:putative methanogenesis marker protein 17|nr:methanogenesis marker 17 protein [Methanofastidiosum sp.]HNZ87680.1 methanogenesis marker 17 protein [Methanofastidiosum sp.]HOC77095.1 methanogenesis marker 17 protein [Methanofastidiosum sp.]HOG73360.1 methanogenesis marker 17 protein [Methanofastidiosum sp.]HPA48611.1 methanogenesis marker 17 protein [Methanofastidiosum sp.]